MHIVNKIRDERSRSHIQFETSDLLCGSPIPLYLDRFYFNLGMHWIFNVVVNVTHFQCIISILQHCLFLKAALVPYNFKYSSDENNIRHMMHIRGLVKQIIKCIAEDYLTLS